MSKVRRKKVTMKDIAEKLNLSVNAVSLALNNKKGISEETRKIVLKTAEDLGYFSVNSNFAVKSSFKSICLLIEERNFRDTSFYTKVILGIENEAKKSGYDVLVNFINPSNFQVPLNLQQMIVSGILIVGTVRDEHLIKILEYGLPTVLVDHASLTVTTNAVLTQNMVGAYRAVQYLVQKGHRQIGFFGEIDYSLSFKERWLGFNEGMRNVGLKVDLEYCVLEGIEKLVLDKNYEQVANIISKLNKLPTAWVCSNDNAAITLYNALNALNIKVPDDISIIGFDDIDICNMVTPRLTTIHVNKELMGAEAVKRLLYIMQHPGEKCKHICIEVSLIERESVKELIDQVVSV